MAKKIIEVLYPDCANLYGELGNIEYLTKSNSDIEIHYTDLIEEPMFFKGNPDLIYLGTLTEHYQEVVLSKLKPYRARLIELIKNGQKFLVTGNAIELFGCGIEDSDGTKVECLNIFPFKAYRNMDKRWNALYLGKFYEDKANLDDFKEVIGFNCQFTYMLKDLSLKAEFKDYDYMFETIRDIKVDERISNFEGIRVNNFNGTYLIGPLLTMNPYLAKYVLRSLGLKDDLAFEDVAFKAYELRKAELKNPNLVYSY